MCHWGLVTKLDSHSWITNCLSLGIQLWNIKPHFFQHNLMVFIHLQVHFGLWVIYVTFLVAHLYSSPSCYFRDCTLVFQSFMLLSWLHIGIQVLYVTFVTAHWYSCPSCCFRDCTLVFKSFMLLSWLNIGIQVLHVTFLAAHWPASPSWYFCGCTLVFKSFMLLSWQYVNIL